MRRALRLPVRWTAWTSKLAQWNSSLASLARVCVTACLGRGQPPCFLCRRSPAGLDAIGMTGAGTGADASPPSAPTMRGSFPFLLFVFVLPRHRATRPHGHPEAGDEACYDVCGAVPLT